MVHFMNFTGSPLSIVEKGKIQSLPVLPTPEIIDVTARWDTSVFIEGILEIQEGTVVGLPRPVPGVMLVTTREVCRRAARADVVYPMEIGEDGLCTHLARITGTV